MFLWLQTTRATGSCIVVLVVNSTKLALCMLTFRCNSIESRGVGGCSPPEIQKWGAAAPLKFESGGLSPLYNTIYGEFVERLIFAQLHN